MAEHLKDRIVRHIQASGPLPLANYMHWCMADREAGYYQTQTVIGRKGDFVTSPEISQMFGELIGIWIRMTWESLSSPPSFNLVELGPGRGTLMADILRTVKSNQAIIQAAHIHLVETGAAMIKSQREKLEDHQNINWHSNLSDIPSRPTILIANEFFDVLPMRQYVKAGGNWFERCIGLSDEEELTWCLGPGSIELDSLPQGHQDEPEGSVFEISLPREAYISKVAQLITETSGAALIIDYGHEQSGFGDTLQAVKAHSYADALEEPGACDLTSHVDFAALASCCAGPVNVHPIMTQGEFLLSMGLLERAGQLGQSADETTRQQLTRQAERLALPHEMGNLFKVMALSTQPALWPFNAPS